MNDPSLPKKVAVEVLEALGWDHESPIARTVLVTALDGLSGESKAELIAFLRARIEAPPHLTPEPQGAFECPTCASRNALWNKVDKLAERVLTEPQGAPLTRTGTAYVEDAEGNVRGVAIIGPRGAPHKPADCPTCGNLYGHDCGDPWHDG